jgi:hypothetical protein
VTDIESRLRAAMRSVADQPPAGLLDGVRRRHRRHLERVTVGCAAAVLAVAVGAQPVAHALRGPGEHGGGSPSAGQLNGYSIVVGLGRPTPALRIITGPMAAAPPAPGANAGGHVVRASCADANPGSVGASWARHATRLAGQTLWLISYGIGRDSGGRASGPNLYPAVLVIAGVRPGATVTVKVAAGAQGQLRFLYGPDESAGPASRLTMHSGTDGVALVACRSGAGPAPEPRDVTVYNGAYLVRGDICVPVHVWLPGRKRPVTTTLGRCG